jgi:uncharacterized protein YllA (UPF0747 family)
VHESSGIGSATNDFHLSRPGSRASLHPDLAGRRAVDVVTRGSGVRARIAARPEPPNDRFFDPLVADLVEGGAFSRSRFAVTWNDTAALGALARAKQRPLDPGLAAELLATHRRLGASPASLRALDSLARGEAVCAVAGQQPAPLGGPLYALHKTASAVALAREVAERTGVPCVPLYWMHGEDSDFAEIRAVMTADRELKADDLALPPGAHRDGELIAGIALDPLRELVTQAITRWEGLPHRAVAEALVRRSLEPARDLGDAISALWLALFGAQGLIVIDPRLPAFRAAARPIVGGYLEQADTLGDVVRRAGDLLERRFQRRPLDGPTLDSFVFAIEDGRRRKVSPAEARAFAGPLSPSVALRAAVQDGVFPTVAMACGAAEVAYLAQLREVFEAVGVRAAAPVPRFGATWLPRAAIALLEAAGVAEIEVIAAADATLKHLAERETPAAARAELERSRREAFESLERYAHQARAVDASLPQMVESARAKIDFQYARLLEGLVGKVRHRLERQHPEWPRLRYYLLPGERLQERRLASLEVVAYRGDAVIGELCDAARDHARRLAEGVHEHYVLEL